MAAARKLLRRSARREAGRFLVEGPQALSVAIGRLRFSELFATATAVDRHADLVSRFDREGVAVRLVDEPAAAALSETVTPQGIVGVAALPESGLEALPPTPQLVAVLVEPRDPGNLGTIIRTADAAGADAVVLCGDAVDPFGGKAIRASAGSVFALPVLEGISVETALEELSARGLELLATTGGAELDLDRALDVDLLAAPTAWLFGNEAHGLPPAVMSAVALAGGSSIRVPVYGAAESLNVAAAAAVCLYASARAQRKRAGEGVGE